MRTLKYNGEKWYWDERSLWKRIRQWLIWIGGWEKANGKGWEFHNPYSNEKLLMSPWPVSFIGHIITLYSWGWEARLGRQHYIVWSKQNGIYVSSDATPPDHGSYNKKGFYICKFNNRKKR